MSKEYFISKRGMEWQVDYESKRSEAFLQKLDKLSIPLENESYRKYIVSSVDFVKAELESNSYRLSLEISRNGSGQAAYVNRDMLENYLLDKGLNMSAKKYMCEYASKLIQGKIDDGTIKEVTPEEIVSSIKQVVCFEALREVSKPDTPIEKLQSQAQVLSEHLTDKNIRALNNKELMKEYSNISESEFRHSNCLNRSEKSVQPLLQKEDIQKELIKENHNREISL